METKQFVDTLAHPHSGPTQVFEAFLVALASQVKLLQYSGGVEGIEGIQNSDGTDPNALWGSAVGSGAASVVLIGTYGGG